MASLFSKHTYNDHSWRCLPQPGTKHRGEWIVRMEDAGTSEEDDDIDSQDSNTPTDHGHLSWNCSIKIKSITMWTNQVTNAFQKYYLQTFRSSYTPLVNTQFFIIPWNILKINYKQTMQRIIIILMTIEPETLQVLLKNSQHHFVCTAALAQMVACLPLFSRSGVRSPAG